MILVPCTEDFEILVYIQSTLIPICWDFLIRDLSWDGKFLFQEICLAAYRGVVQPESEDKRIISAQWATDEDISRLLKSLPNWQLAVSDTPSIIEGGGGASPGGGGSGGPQNVSAESPQEVEQRNARVSQQLLLRVVVIFVEVILCHTHSNRIVKHSTQGEQKHFHNRAWLKSQ